MAERGIIVTPGSTGTSVACRDAEENDSLGNARVIQKIETMGGGKLPEPFRHADNLIRSTVLEDGVIAANWTAAGVFTNLLTDLSIISISGRSENSFSSFNENATSSSSIRKG